MPFTAHDLRYKAAETYPSLFSYLYKLAQKSFGPLSDDQTELDIVIGQVIEQLVRIGLLGGEDKTPLTPLDQLNNAQFYAFLNRSIKNQVIDRLRKRRNISLDQSKDKSKEKEAYIQEDDLTNVIDPPLNSAFSREDTLELALRQAYHALSDAYFHKILKPSVGDEKSLDNPGTIQVIDKQIEEKGLSSIRIGIKEEPLTVLNMSIIISAFIELHTKFWLIEKSRLTDLIEYTQTHNPRFVEEANLLIGKMTYHSPGWIEFITASGPFISEALKTATAILQTPLQVKAKELDNEAKELDLRLKEQTAEAEIADKTQNRQIEAQKAELENQRGQLELQERRLEIMKKQLEIQEQQLELGKKRVEFALEIAHKTVEVFPLEIDNVTKAMLAETLLPNLLHLGTVKGVELIQPPSSQID